MLPNKLYAYSWGPILYMFCVKYNNYFKKHGSKSELFYIAEIIYINKLRHQKQNS